MKRRSLIALLLILVLLLTGCEGVMDEPIVFDTLEIEANEAYEESAALAQEDFASISAVTDRKLIHSSQLRLETKAFDETVSQIHALVTEMGGYMEESRVEGDAYGDWGRCASFTCRVPASRFASANERLGGLGNVVSRTETAEDVTDHYYDVEAELDALEIQQERLLAMMEQATQMEDLIALEEALTEVRYRINDRTSTIKRYDGLIEYATICIELEEVVEYQETTPETFGDRIADTFFGSLEFVREFGEGIVLVFVAVAPFVVIYGGMAALLAGIILLIVKLVRKHKKTKNFGK